jgi:hypothetical protein
MGARQANLSVYHASACGIPASRPLSVLDRDKAYFLLRCVHRVPCTPKDLCPTRHVCKSKPSFLQTITRPFGRINAIADHYRDTLDEIIKRINQLLPEADTLIRKLPED